MLGSIILFEVISDGEDIVLLLGGDNLVVDVVIEVEFVM